METDQRAALHIPDGTLAVPAGTSHACTRSLLLSARAAEYRALHASVPELVTSASGQPPRDERRQRFCAQAPPRDKDHHS